jgi:hypothetical protein
MDIESAVMKVDWHDARKKYDAYKAAVASGKATADDEAILAALKRIAQGQQVIDIALAIQGAGLNEHNLPKLAIARADWPRVHAWWWEQKVVFTARPKSWNTTSNDRVASHSVAVRLEWVPRPSARGIGETHGQAQVPTVPPDHRPKGALTYYRILFEAEWKRVPPVDPILLRHLGGPFYAVMASWNLSPLEQAVLRAKL